jgi:hypothetical protein
MTGEAWAAIAGAVGSAFLLARKLLSPKRPDKPEGVSRAEFYAQMLAVTERINATHLAMLDKLDANQRQLLGALDALGLRVSTLEATVARLDERTRKQP